MKIEDIPEVLQVQDINNQCLLALTINNELLIKNQHYPEGKLIELDQSIRFVRYVDTYHYLNHGILILIDQDYNLHSYSTKELDGIEPLLSLQLLDTMITSISSHGSYTLWLKKDTVTVYDGVEAVVLEAPCSMRMAMGNYLISDDNTIYSWSVGFTHSGVRETKVELILITKLILKANYTIKQVATYPNNNLTTIDIDGEVRIYSDSRLSTIRRDDIHRFIIVNGYTHAELEDGRIDIERYRDDNWLRLLNLDERYGARVKSSVG